jgi:hypothetical protein
MESRQKIETNIFHKIKTHVIHKVKSFRKIHKIEKAPLGALRGHL